MSSTSLPTKLCPFQVSYRPCGIDYCTWTTCPLKLGDRRPSFVPRHPVASSMCPALALAIMPYFHGMTASGECVDFLTALQSFTDCILEISQIHEYTAQRLPLNLECHDGLCQGKETLCLFTHIVNVMFLSCKRTFKATWETCRGADRFNDP